MSRVVTLRFNKLIWMKNAWFPTASFEYYGRFLLILSIRVFRLVLSLRVFRWLSFRDFRLRVFLRGISLFKGFPRFLGLPRFLSFPRFLRLPCFLSFPRFLGFLYLKSFSWGWCRRRQCLNNRGVAMTVSNDICYDLSFRGGLGVTIHHDIPKRLCSDLIVHLHKLRTVFSKDLFRSNVDLLSITGRSEQDRALCITSNIGVILAFGKHVL